MDYYDIELNSDSAWARANVGIFLADGTPVSYAERRSGATYYTQLSYCDTVELGDVFSTAGRLVLSELAFDCLKHLDITSNAYVYALVLLDEDSRGNMAPAVKTVCIEYINSICCMAATDRERFRSASVVSRWAGESEPAVLQRSLVPNVDSFYEETCMTVVSQRFKEAVDFNALQGFRFDEVQIL